MNDLACLIARAAELLARARMAVALTGAGISTPSGIPDFRSPGSGLWAGTDPLEVASMLTFRYHPERFYAWIRPLAALLQAARPNPAHHALAALEAAGGLHTIITQNIDELHARAGSRSVLEVHGSIREATCIRCYTRLPGSAILARFVEDGVPPQCPACQGLLKPNVTLMGEELPVSVLHAARKAARECDVMLVAGCSLEVMPAAGIPMEALEHGAHLIIVNLEPTYLDERAEVVIQADVAEVLPQITGAAGLRAHDRRHAT